MRNLFGVNIGELPEWLSIWTRRLLAGDKFDVTICELLAEIGEIVSADRSLIYRTDESQHRFDLITEWCAPGVEAIRELVPSLTLDDIPVLGARILKSKAVIFTHPDELPERAMKERKLLTTSGTESVFASPLSARGKVVGMLVVEANPERREWDSESITFLSAVAGILSAALDQHEIDLHGFLEASTDFAGIADFETHELVYLNPAGRELIKLPEDASLDGLTIDQITPEPVMKLKREVIYPAVLEKGNWHGELSIRSLDGEEIPVLQMLVKLPLPDSPLKFGIGSIIHDLRKRRAAENQLIDSERLLRNMIATAPHALYLLNYDSGRMEIGEENFARMTGYTAEELRQFPGGVYDPIHPDDIPAVRAQEAALAEAGDDEKVVPAVFRFLRKDGHWDWVEVHSRVFERDEDGKPLSEVGMAQIVTGRKLDEDKLRRSEERIGSSRSGHPGWTLGN